MSEKTSRDKKLKSALRDNLKKRKNQSRKFKAMAEEKSGVLKLRESEIAKKV